VLKPVVQADVVVIESLQEGVSMDREETKSTEKAVVINHSLGELREWLQKYREHLDRKREIQATIKRFGDYPGGADLALVIVNGLPPLPDIPSRQEVEAWPGMDVIRRLAILEGISDIFDRKCVESGVALRFADELRMKVAQRLGAERIEEADRLALVQVEKTLRADDPAAAGNRNKRQKRSRRRKANQPVRPLTAKQTEAVHLVSEHKGNFTAAAAAAGISRAAIKKRYDLAMKKLGKRAMPTAKTTRLPTDRRGQPTL
jgi:hypothetical protein